MEKIPFVIERARPEDAAAQLEYLKIIGGETDNLSFGPEGVPLSREEEEAYLRAGTINPFCRVGPAYSVKRKIRRFF